MHVKRKYLLVSETKTSDGTVILQPPLTKWCISPFMVLLALDSLECLVSYKIKASLMKCICCFCNHYLGHDQCQPLGAGRLVYFYAQPNGEIQNIVSTGKEYETTITFVR